VESHGFEHGFPLIRSLRASAQRSASVLFSFVLSFDYGRSICRPAIKNDSSAMLWGASGQRFGLSNLGAVIFAVIGHLHDWIRDKMSRLTPAAQIQRND
jgi:hypothetical protein